MKVDCGGDCMMIHPCVFILLTWCQSHLFFSSSPFFPETTHTHTHTRAQNKSQSTRSLAQTLLHVPGFGQRRVPAYVERLVYLIQNHGFNRLQRHTRLSKAREQFKRNMSVGVFQHCSVLFTLLKGSFRHREGIQRVSQEEFTYVNL